MASGTATVTVSGNAVTAVTITDAGSGYTFASIKASEIGNVSGADIDFIISMRGWTCYRRCKRTWWILCNDEC